MGVAFRMTFQHGRPVRVQVRHGSQLGPALVEVTAVPGEHPTGPLDRALDHAQRALDAR
jgi:hypothetical protein